MMRLRALAFGLMLLTACGGASESSEDESATPAVVGARTSVASIRPFAQELTVIGVISPRPGTYAALGAPAATRVARIFAMVGQRVDRGAPLVEFERGPFEAAARSAEAALAAAQRNRERATRLTEAGVAPRKDLDQALAELAQAEAAAVTARRTLELATLTAPVTGIVTRMNAVVGAPVDVNQPLIEVADPAALDVVFNLSPTDAGRVRTGQAITITADQGAQSNILAHGVLTGVALEVDSTSRTVAVRGRVSRAERPLRIGETVLGRIATGVHPNAVSVPSDALVPQGEGFKVFVVDSTGVVHGQSVEIGSRAEGSVEIISGLAGGETVVTYGAYGMDDGARIAPIKP